MSVPSLPGCFTQGETYDEAVEMAKDAIEGYLTSFTKHGEPIPVDKVQTDSIETQVEIQSSSLV